MIISPLWGLACLLAGWFTAYLLRNIPDQSCFHTGRHQNLDGLRGLLAFLVFICHASTWQQYLADQRWRISETPLYVLPAQTSIVIFFMLTGFLFTRKFLNSNNPSENWIRLYVSRLLRLGPAYLLMLTVLAGVVAWQIAHDQARWSDCHWRDGLAWLAFTLPGAPPLCGYEKTSIAVSGVTWSLTYEWAFYFCLPFLALITRKRVSLAVLFLCGAALAVTVLALPLYSVVYLSFGVGVASAFLDFRFPLVWLRQSPYAGGLAVMLLVVNGLVHRETSYTITSVFIIGLAFHIFASGNTLMGMLNTRTFQVFGLCTYTLYLFHGLLLYIALSALTSVFPLLHTDHVAYWLSIVFLTPLLVAGTLFIYLRIERPPLLRAQGVSAAIEMWLYRWNSAVTSYFRQRIK